MEEEVEVIRSIPSSRRDRSPLNLPGKSKLKEFPCFEFFSYFAYPVSPHSHPTFFTQQSSLHAVEIKVLLSDLQIQGYETKKRKKQQMKEFPQFNTKNIFLLHDRIYPLNAILQKTRTSAFHQR
jgi:hypothetical protein